MDMIERVDERHEPRQHGEGCSGRWSPLSKNPQFEHDAQPQPHNSTYALWVCHSVHFVYHFHDRVSPHSCNEPGVPLILYAADYPYTTYTNTSDLASGFSASQLTQLTDNGLPLLSQDANRLREGWTQCIACAAIDRSLSRVSMKRPEACERCFEKYCWDGKTVNETQPSFVGPFLVLNQSVPWVDWNATFLRMTSGVSTS